MSYEYEIQNVPQSVDVGEPFSPSVEVCCTLDGGCPDEYLSLSIDRSTVGTEGVGFIHSDCFGLEFAGQDYQGSIDNPPFIDYEAGGSAEIAITEPGTYSLTFDSSDGFSESVSIEAVSTVSESDVSVSCNVVDESVSVDQRAVVEVTITNDSTANASVDWVLDIDGLGTESFSDVVVGQESIEVGLEFDETGSYPISSEIVGVREA